MKLEELYKRLITKEGQKLKGTFVGQEAVEAAGGEWDPEAIQWVDYFDEEERANSNVLYPWCDMTLLVESNAMAGMRPATPGDLRRLGYMTREEWEREER